MRGPPVVLTNTLGRPVTNVISERGAVPMTVVNTLGEPVTLVNSGGEPVTLFNANGTLWDYPFSLFSNNEQGAWYDPSDFSTLFQNSTGTTPVTAVEQPVRLMLDRSGRGNHATAPNDASRPVLRARYNQITFSEQFNDAGWTKQRTTVTANAVTAPDGTTTADAVFETVDSGTHGVFQTITKAASATTYAVSCYVKPNGRDWAILQLNGPGETNRVRVWFDLSGSGAVGSNVAAGTGFSFVSASIQSLADGWYRCTTVITGDTATTYTAFVRTATGDTLDVYVGDITKGLYVWGAQLLTAADQSATGGAYQRIAAATDYDTSNPVFRPYLAFDGSDDAMTTASVDLTGTDEVALFVGVTKLGAETTTGIIDRQNVANPGTNKGVIGLLHGLGSPIRTYDFRATTDNAINSTVQAFTESTAFNAPSTNVLTGQTDAGAPLLTLRVNGSQVGTANTAQGGGNFGNFPFTIGSRTNSAGYFTGRFYSIAVLGRTATAAELGAMEAWVAGKTGVTI